MTKWGPSPTPGCTGLLRLEGQRVGVTRDRVDRVPYPWRRPIPSRVIYDLPLSNQPGPRESSSSISSRGGKNETLCCRRCPASDRLAKGADRDLIWVSSPRGDPMHGGKRDTRQENPLRNGVRIWGTKTRNRESSGKVSPGRLGPPSDASIPEVHHQRWSAED
ncbi:uncharacterized protein BP01DRAFT_74987 [Aspergillus saccharolyticus JOP 1030-1]|uniref:Uncharacterized protein n=1 Tax=Aspergillus saccharolyticus JOP 1030-1 TaxID=1450539 RepID=A0A318ZNR0_9EURO|nr:hypothetical protein BP01DRAFT_74987 [Aspergillus saccharolyticus JOP 1030-1]PYH49261.1 hypothetical protein BP01DRAFT_74987 [Aspergillus saccharolyticus JOP 1030-1]